MITMRGSFTRSNYSYRMRVFNANNLIAIPTLISNQKKIYRIFNDKEVVLVDLLHEFLGHLTIVFTESIEEVQRITIICRALGFNVVPLDGLTPSIRSEALNACMSERSILIATEDGTRGLNIPFVDLVLNYEVPHSTNSYVYRVSMTSRERRLGTAITLFSTPHDIQTISRIENGLRRRLIIHGINDFHIEQLYEVVNQAKQKAAREMILS